MHRVKLTPIILTFSLAVLLNVISSPFPILFNGLRPHWLMLVVLSWSLLEPDRFGVGVAWLIGVLTDIIQGGPLGEHAFIFTIVVYFLVKFNRRIFFAPFLNKFLIVLGLVFLSYLLQFWIEQFLGNRAQNLLNFWLSAFLTALLWPLLFKFLQRWQRDHEFF